MFLSLKREVRARKKQQNAVTLTDEDLVMHSSVTLVAFAMFTLVEGPAVEIFRLPMFVPYSIFGGSLLFFSAIGEPYFVSRHMKLVDQKRQEEDDKFNKTDPEELQDAAGASADIAELPAVVQEESQPWWLRFLPWRPKRSPEPQGTQQASQVQTMHARNGVAGPEETSAMDDSPSPSAPCDTAACESALADPRTWHPVHSQRVRHTPAGRVHTGWAGGSVAEAYRRTAPGAPATHMKRLSWRALPNPCFLRHQLHACTKVSAEPHTYTHAHTHTHT
jgi:hypothetical protein